MSKRVAFITGIDGFTGRYLSLELSQAGYEVVGIARELPNKPITGAQKVHVCDLNDAEALSRILEIVQPDVVAHLAAISYVAEEDTDLIYRTNFIGSRHLLDALTDLQKKPNAVLLASSAQVYGSVSGIISEKTPLAPMNDYAVSKLAMENMAALYKKHLPIIIVRPFNYTGIGQSSKFLVPKIAEQMRNGVSVIELGNLDVTRDFSDVRTVVRDYRLLLESSSALGGVYNICSGQSLSVYQILEMIGKLAGYCPQIKMNHDFIRKNEIRELLGDRSRLVAITGGESKVIPFTETLRWMMGAH